jgi:hypothetical protein
MKLTPTIWFCFGYMDSASWQTRVAALAKAYLRAVGKWIETEAAS